MDDTQSRKYQLTINRPIEKDLSHDEIKRILGQLKSLVYWCISDEIGLENKTPHTHVFLFLRSPARFSRIKKLFPMAHAESARGTAAENRAYVEKSGKWASDPKADTSIPGTFEESGELPDEPGRGYRSDMVDLYHKIKDGFSNAAIMEENPKQAMHIGKMDKIRQEILGDQYATTWRNLDVTYIFGPTGTGKTRSVMETYGYENVYRVTDYRNPFDRYVSEDVLCLDEFRSSLPIGDMLNYLDGYPLVLPARYSQKQACYTKVFLISNIDLKAQYKNVQQFEHSTWKALLRRIAHVTEFRSAGAPIDRGSAMDYIFPAPPPVPDWINDADDAPDIEQIPF